MKTKHTPEPWKVLLMGDEELGFVLSLHDSEGKNFANIKLFGTKEEVEANARLIASAPKLYKVVCMDRDKHLMGKEKFQKKYGIDWEEINNYRLQAISKAGGENV